MKKFFSCFVAAAVGLFFTGKKIVAQSTVVILGSSTAAGIGPSSYANSWVGKFTGYAQSVNPVNTVINLAVGGFRTTSVMPTGTGGEDANHNITKALTYNPTAIIVNLPTNDAADGIPLATTMANFRLLRQLATTAGAAFWITTAQPRNLSVSGLALLFATRDSINAQFGTKAIDFWTTLANTDGTISSLYSAGDGIHINDAGHEIFFQRVKAKPILAPAALPVFFERFTASVAGSSVRLDWQVNRGGQMYPQEIEASADGNFFTQIGTVAPSSGERFSFVDVRPLRPLMHYRIKIVTLAGVKYSDVVRLSLSEKGSKINVFSNPVTGSLLRAQLQLELDVNGALSIYDCTAREVFRKALDAQKGVTSLAIQLPQGLQKGLYFIIFSNGKKLTGKIFYCNRQSLSTC